ncbi:hypothetical protein SAMN05216289_1243 [Dokdonella immobilis]|uniref:Uncharacterized protein n=1 Tax=Dokdonella immobilis TaxID=578942 RepID=A0A1I4Z9W1_9GAMM|nr:hypothetical protein [Dokdonella immobilis]SFN46977.1 hypothetical protein SAMN05216289_1243 [Dokdonella immobilis]
MVSARLQSTNTVIARYATNAFGGRVCKAGSKGQCPRGPGNTDPADTGSGPFSQYVNDDAGHLLGEYTEAGALIAEHVWLDDTPVALIKPIEWAASHGGQNAGNVAVFAVEPDHLDTPRVIVNASHQTVWRWDSSPFGDAAATRQPTKHRPAWPHSATACASPASSTTRRRRATTTTSGTMSRGPGGIWSRIRLGNGVIYKPTNSFVRRLCVARTGAVLPWKSNP